MQSPISPISESNGTLRKKKMEKKISALRGKRKNKKISNGKKEKNTVGII